MTEARPSRTSIETTLLRAALGYRVFGTIWLLLLGAIVLVSRSSPVDRPGVVAVTMGAVTAWTACAVYVSFRNRRWLETWWFLATDTIIAVLSLMAGTWAGSSTFAGGYPLTAIFAAIYGRGTAGGLFAASALTATAVVRLSGTTQDPAAQTSFVIVYIFSAAAAAWIFAAIRSADRRRVTAEQALAEQQVRLARSEERAEVAAHLHDSVLQTLALIQRRAQDGDEVTALARRQERELRDWLYGHQVLSDGGFREAVVAMGAEVEDMVGTPVEVVVVGDCERTPSVNALIKAGREAAINAGKHSGTDEISIYGEARDGSVALFVKDRGSGFDPATIDAERRGIAESIIQRMERHGGTATVHSEPGAGTEVQLKLEKWEMT
jgi:signal transduction histidine kinase